MLLFSVDTPVHVLKQALWRCNHTRETLSTSLQNLRKRNLTLLSGTVRAQLQKVTIITLTYSKIIN